MTTTARIARLQELEGLRDQVVATSTRRTAVGSTYTVSRCRGFTRDELIEYNQLREERQ